MYKSEEQRQAAINRATKWQEDNREAHNDHVREYSKRNPEVGKAAYKKWLDKNKGTLAYAQRDMLNRTKARCKRTGQVFDIELSNITDIWPADNCCPVLKIEFDLTGQNRWHSPSIDRINSDRGYTVDNIVIISYRANSIKQDSTLDELRLLLDFYENLTC